MQTPGGEQPIARLRVGDHVTSYDPTTGKATTQTITHVYLNHDSDRLDVTLALPASSNATHSPTTAQDAATARTQRGLVMSHGRRGPPDATATTASNASAASDETIHTTAHHPWLTADRGWVEAGQLHAGEPVRLLDGATATVAGLHAVPGAGPMWDLSLDATHTFAVGASRAVVHNDDCITFENRYPEKLQSELERADALGVKPLKPGEPGFQQMTQQGTLKWALTENGELNFMPKEVDGEEIPHTALTRGAPVQDAGEVTLVGTGGGGYRAEGFSHSSGHYRPDEDLPLPGAQAFSNAGISIPGYFFGF